MSCPSSWGVRPSGAGGAADKSEVLRTLPRPTSEAAVDLDLVGYGCLREIDHAVTGQQEAELEVLSEDTCPVGKGVACGEPQDTGLTAVMRVRRENGERDEEGPDPALVPYSARQNWTFSPGRDSRGARGAENRRSP